MDKQAEEGSAFDTQLNSIETRISKKTISIWKLILSQLRTKVLYHRQVKKLQQLLASKINISWKTISDINTRIREARKKFT